MCGGSFNYSKKQCARERLPEKSRQIYKQRNGWCWMWTLCLVHVINKKSSLNGIHVIKMVILLLKDDHKTAMLFPTSHYFPIKRKSAAYSANSSAMLFDLSMVSYGIQWNALDSREIYRLQTRQRLRGRRYNIRTHRHITFKRSHTHTHKHSCCRRTPQFWWQFGSMHRITFI